MNNIISILHAANSVRSTKLTKNFEGYNISSIWFRYVIHKTYYRLAGGDLFSQGDTLEAIHRQR